MKRILSLILAVALCSLLISQAFLTAGTTEDPVISLSYLNNTLRESLLEDSQKQIDAYQAQQLSNLYAAYANQIAAKNYSVALQSQTAQHLQGRTLLKAGDLVYMAAGTQVTLLYGAANANTANLVNISQGEKHTIGSALTANERYMMNDKADGGIYITSDTAEVFINGVYSLGYSASMDYASLADALYEMDLFAGTEGAITGYALEQSCVRIEALVMFLRLIGVADEAANYQGRHPFTDVPSWHWANNYLAYAYQNGLAYGTSTTKFSPSNKVTAQEYLTFLMRALNYVEGTEFSYNTVLTDVVRLGVFSQAEMNAINTSTFLRHKMVYLSYYTLFATEQKSGLSLILQLVDAGNVDLNSAIAGAGKVVGGRFS